VNNRGDDPSRRGALAALIVIAVLLVRGLRRNAALQDCIMSGRRDCAPFDAGRAR
jgi:hypothetical protein